MSAFSKEYGDGIYALARDEGITAQVMTEIEALEGLFAGEPDFVRLLDNRTVPLNARENAVKAALEGQVHAYVVNFLMLLTRRGGIREFPACVSRFRENYYRDNNITVVDACVSAPLGAEQRSRLIEKLKQMTGHDIILKERIDKSLLGGISVSVDGKKIDNTIKSRIEALRREMRKDA